VSEVPIGASRVGRSPDVTEYFFWPEGEVNPMGLILQVNLEELQAVADVDFFPGRGHSLYSLTGKDFVVRSW
jgi:uncharacterized protein YwqG